MADSPYSTHSVSGIVAAWSLAVREWKRFYRQKSRVFSALVTPTLFWLLLGSGLNRSFQPGGTSPSPAPAPDPAVGNTGSLPAAGLQPADLPADQLAQAGQDLGYLAFFFPGALSMIVLFTAVFATITVVEDRREGFMQGVLASPIPRWAIVAGKVIGSLGIALLHALIFLLLWPLTESSLASQVGVIGWIKVAVLLVLLGGGLTALAFTLAWRMNSTAGFHAVMMVFLMPMWFLCGAVFPADGASAWIHGLMLANPLSYGQMLLTDTLTAGQMSTGLAVAALPAWLVTVAWCLLAGRLAWTSVQRNPLSPTT